MTSASTNISALKGFRLLRVLDQDAKQRTASLLGHFSPPSASSDVSSPSADSASPSASAAASEQAIVLLEKTHFSPDFFSTLGEQPLRLTQLGQNDIYSWFLAWSSDERGNDKGVQQQVAPKDADMKINIIRPATEAHIKKYERQDKVMVYGESAQ